MGKLDGKVAVILGASSIEGLGGVIAKSYANEGVAQFIFLKGNEKPEVTYADRNGKYMGQTGVTLPKV